MGQDACVGMSSLYRVERSFTLVFALPSPLFKIEQAFILGCALANDLAFVSRVKVRSSRNPIDTIEFNLDIHAGKDGLRHLLRRSENKNGNQENNDDNPSASHHNPKRILEFVVPLFFRREFRLRFC